MNLTNVGTQYTHHWCHRARRFSGREQAAPLSLLLAARKSLVTGHPILRSAQLAVRSTVPPNHNVKIDCYCLPFLRNRFLWIAMILRK